MECPRCGLPMQRHIGINGQVFWECACGNIKDTPDLDTVFYDSWEVNNES